MINNNPQGFNNKKAQIGDFLPSKVCDEKRPSNYNWMGKKKFRFIPREELPVVTKHAIT